MAQSNESITMALLNDPEPVFICVKKYHDEFTPNIINGDVFIVEESKKAHKAGVYLDRQIVQLKTEVNKVNVNSFTGGKRFAVYRKRKGIPQSFQENVAEALSGIPEINFSQYNSVEFVMELLDVPSEPTASDFKKIAYWSKPKGFKVVKKLSDEYGGNAKLGDLFLVQTGIIGFRYYHAGVCCSEKGPEIIQFMANGIGSISGPRSGASVSSSIPCSGVVNKVHINGFSSGSKYVIYRLKMGISDSFQDRVDEAMSNINKYKLLSYNCIHFALELIYGKELKKEENDVEKLIEEFFG